VAKLYITEFTDIARNFNSGPMAAPAAPPVASQAVTFTTTTQSAAFNVATKLIMVQADAICSVEIGADPTATVNSMRMAAGETRFYGVTPGHKIAAVTNS
jgi:hypothetical protein